MTSIATLKILNAHRWDNMHVKASRMSGPEGFHSVAAKLLQHKDQYQAIEVATKVPWFIVAVIHEREADANFNAQLGQGDPLSHMSIHVPKGRGPFLPHPSDTPLHGPFFRGALDALIDCPPYAAKNTDWSIGGSLEKLEEYNGLGYAGMGRPSPYVWSGTDQYISGKYVADGVYNAHAVDVQLGCAPLIATIMAMDPTAKFNEGPVA